MKHSDVLIGFYKNGAGNFSKKKLSEVDGNAVTAGAQ
jgi:hypothetical protein